MRVAVIAPESTSTIPTWRAVFKAQNFVDQGERSFTTDFHGTAVAGVIAAAANNEVGIVGVAPQAQIYALKACWQQPAGAREAVCNSYTLAKAVDFAISERAHVLNFSLAGPPDVLLTRLIKVALERGIAVIAAAPSKPDARAFPASMQGVIGISGRIHRRFLGRRRGHPDDVPRGSYDSLRSRSRRPGLGWRPCPGPPPAHRPSSRPSSTNRPPSNRRLAALVRPPHRLLP